MPKALPWARTFLNDLLGECTALGLGLRERGILLTLLWVQHMNGGSIPADPRELRRLVGDNAQLEEIKVVVANFFPLTEKGRRSNRQHAEAQAVADRAYQATVRGGQMRAAQRWGTDSSATSSATSSANSPGGSNQNQNQNYNENQNSPEASRGNVGEQAVKKIGPDIHAPADLDEAEDDDEPPF